MTKDRSALILSPFQEFVTLPPPWCSNFCNFGCVWVDVLIFSYYCLYRDLLSVVRPLLTFLICDIFRVASRIELKLGGKHRG